MSSHRAVIMACNMKSNDNDMVQLSLFVLSVYKV